MVKIFNKLSNIVNSYLEKKEGLHKYQQILTHFLMDGVISESESEQLAYLEDRYCLGKAEIRKNIVSALKKYFEKVIEDKKITESEKISLETLLNYFEISPHEIGFNQDIFNKYYTLGLIDEGKLPIIQPENHDINIVFKNKEHLHFGSMSNLLKLKNAVKYYDDGISLTPKKQEFFEIEDNGIFYITNQRIGFIGDRKHFSFALNKTASFRLTESGLFIFKSGR